MIAVNFLKISANNPIVGPFTAPSFDYYDILPRGACFGKFTVLSSLPTALHFQTRRLRSFSQHRISLTHFSRLSRRPSKNPEYRKKCCKLLTLCALLWYSSPRREQLVATFLSFLYLPLCWDVIHVFSRNPRFWQMF